MCYVMLYPLSIYLKCYLDLYVMLCYVFCVLHYLFYYIFNFPVLSGAGTKVTSNNSGNTPSVVKMREASKVCESAK